MVILLSMLLIDVMDLWFASIERSLFIEMFDTNLLPDLSSNTMFSNSFSSIWIASIVESYILLISSWLSTKIELLLIPDSIGIESRSTLIK